MAGQLGRASLVSGQHPGKTRSATHKESEKSILMVCEVLEKLKRVARLSPGRLADGGFLLRLIA